MEASTIGAVDETLYFIAAFAFLLFFAIIFIMVYFAARYRASRNPIPTEIHGNNLLEILWIVLPTLLALSMFFYGLTGYNFLRHAPLGSFEATVHARQWSWLFEYPDGKKTPDLVVPEGRDIKLTIASDDVIHGFYLPAYRIQVDAVPGMKTYAWFKASRVGAFDILCTVYCGINHSGMLAKLYVLPQDKYDSWRAGGAAEVSGFKLPEAQASGLSLLALHGCLGCHSTDGSRLTGPTFRGLFGSTVSLKATKAGEPASVLADEAYLRESILDPGAKLVLGFPDSMPARKDLSPREVEGLVDGIEALR
jgi:cytochrome c oxidase subunit II